MWVSFFATITPAYPALMLPAGCGRRYLCVITPNGGQERTQLRWSSLGVKTSSSLISGCTQQNDWYVSENLRLHERLVNHWSFNKLPRQQFYFQCSYLYSCPLKMHRVVGTAFDVWCSLRFIFRIVISCVRVNNSQDDMLPQALLHGLNWCKVCNNSKIGTHYAIGFYYSILVFIVEYLSLDKGREQTYSFWWSKIKNTLMVIVKSCKCCQKCCCINTQTVHILKIRNCTIIDVPFCSSCLDKGLLYVTYTNTPHHWSINVSSSHSLGCFKTLSYPYKSGSLLGLHVKGHLLQMSSPHSNVQMLSACHLSNVQGLVGSTPSPSRLSKLLSWAGLSLLWLQQ